MREENASCAFPSQRRGAVLGCLCRGAAQELFAQSGPDLFYSATCILPRSRKLPDSFLLLRKAGGSNSLSELSFPSLLGGRKGSARQS